MFLAATGVAHAESGMLPNGASITFDRLKIRENGGALVEPSTPDATRLYLNQAHCVCSQSQAGMEQTLSYDLSLTIDTNTNRPVEIWVGTQCDDDVVRAMNCRSIDSIPDIDLLATRPETVEVSIYDVINGPDNTEACRTAAGDAFIWTLVDSDGDNSYDYFNNQSIGMSADVSGIDTEPPPLPTEFIGASAEGGINLTWTPPEARMNDIDSYQTLCAKSDGSPAFETAPFTPLYQTVRTLCGLEQDIPVMPADIQSTDAGVATLIPELARLNPAYVCGETLDTTASGMLIEGLENNIPYTVTLLSIDRYGNASGVYFVKTITPRPATDFWEDLHDRGSNVEGGFCLFGGTWTSMGPLALAIAWLLSRRRRGFARALARTAPAAVITFMVLAPTTANAQSTNTPYWEADEDAAAADLEDRVRWHAGIRLGPYTPAIDAQFGMDPGPYAEMFGGDQVLPMIDVDRIIWSGFGQVGVGGSIGYMQKSANAWADGSTPGDPMRERSPGDENTFRLLPLAATATYRFTVLDDLYGIPFVPYVRGGLSYYLWWIKTNGDTSTACWDGTHDPDCDTDSAIGASLGVQGAVGIAIRAERIDASAATSMRQGGIQHAGFYAELSAAKVDGFGSGTKLSIGDTTWFAGVDFEF